MRIAWNILLFVLSLALASAVLTTSAGCSDYEDDGYERDRRGDGFDRDYYDDRDYDDRRDRDRDRDDWDRRDRDRDDDWDRDDRGEIRIPRDADVVANGDRSLGYTASRDGRVFVRDEKSGKVIYAGRMRAGQKLTIEPGRRGVAVDGRTVKGELDNKPRERDVFFRPDRGAEPKQSKKKVDRVVP